MTPRQRIKLAIIVDTLEHLAKLAREAPEAATAQLAKYDGGTIAIVDHAVRSGIYQARLEAVRDRLGPIVDDLRLTFKLPRTL